MSDFNMAEKLWDLANLVTGFGVVQTLATTFAIAKRELKGFKGPTPHRFAFAGAVVFTLFYVIAILWCGRIGSLLDKAGNSQVWTVVTFGRVSSILLFTLVMLGALYGHWRDEVERSKVTCATLRAAVWLFGRGGRERRAA